MLFGTTVLMVWMYSLAVHANSTSVDSDGATVILQGQAVATGHVLLHGWTLSLDSWWTLDVVFYALATAVVGVRPVLLLAVPALIAALVVLMGIVMSRRGRQGGAAIAGSITVLAVLALPTHALAANFIVGPIHVSTALFALAAFWGLRRGRLGLGWLIAVILLAAGLLGDLQMLSYGVIPAVIAGLVAMARRRSISAGSATVSAGVASVALALAIRKLVVLLGGFQLGATNSTASPHQLLLNLERLLPNLAELLGLDNSSYGTGGVPVALQTVHVIVAALLALSLVKGVVRLVGGAWRGSTPSEPAGSLNGQEVDPWRLDDLLVVATLGPVVDFVVLSRDSSSYVRYLTAAVIFATILAGRFVTLWWARPHRGNLQARVLFVGAITTACFLAASGLQLSQPAPPSAISPLVSYLEAHHLTLGVGDFWAASITTVESSGKVKVRPLVPTPDGMLEAYNKGETPGWFDGKLFQFVVYPESNGPASTINVSLLTASKTWGAPASTYSVAGYTILQWRHPITVTAFQPRL
jgi:hypothetical protein